MKVLTTKGLVDFDQLRVVDSVEVGDNYRKISSRWYLGDELVKGDAAVSMLRPIESVAEQGVMS